MSINLNNGVPGNVSGSVIAAGYVGQVITNTGSNITIVSQGSGGTAVATVTLPAGVWAMGAMFQMAGSVLLDT